MITHGDALAKLAQFVFVQAIAQFRLAHQNDLQEFAIVGFEIREQADLFEHFFAQVLGFVDDEHGLFALLDLAEQKFVEDGKRIETVEAEVLNRQTEFGGDRLHELVSVQRGIQNEGGGITAATELLEHRAAERGLAGANFAGELHKAFALANSVKQVIEGFTVFGAVKQEPRVRGNIERRLGQAIIVKIHRGTLSRKSA